MERARSADDVSLALAPDERLRNLGFFALGEDEDCFWIMDPGTGIFWLLFRCAR